MRGTRGSELLLHNRAWLMLAIARKFDEDGTAPTCSLAFGTLCCCIAPVSRMAQRRVNWMAVDQ